MAYKVTFSKNITFLKVGSGAQRFTTTTSAFLVLILVKGGLHHYLNVLDLVQ